MHTTCLDILFGLCQMDVQAASCFLQLFLGRLFLGQLFFSQFFRSQLFRIHVLLTP